MPDSSSSSEQQRWIRILAAFAALALAAMLIPALFLSNGSKREESAQAPATESAPAFLPKTDPAAPVKSGSTDGPASGAATASSAPATFLPASRTRPAVVLSEPPLHLMDGYGSPSAAPSADIGLLDDTVRAFLSAVPVTQRPPMGTNAEFTRALTGDNTVRVAFVPPDSPAIVNGELTDRWGTPLFFHAVANNEVEIRSAGPDRIMWTADDLATAPINASKYGLKGP